MATAVQTYTHDVVIVGGGHNALVAAAYIARAGHSVVVLERLSHLGGAAVSERPWAGVDARLSRYSYLVSLLPRQIIDDLGLHIDLRRRRYSSYTPDPADPARGILSIRGMLRPPPRHSSAQPATPTKPPVSLRSPNVSRRSVSGSFRR
jgi:phytoene dehydrogenase-like protein